LPAIYAARDYATAGGLISFGVDYPDLYRRAATYVDKIIKGAKPADLPVEQPTKFELVINQKAAKAVRRPRSRDRFLDRAIRSGRYATGRDHSSPTGDHAVYARPQAAFRGCRRRADGGRARSAQWDHQGRLRPLDRNHP